MEKSETRVSRRLAWLPRRNNRPAPLAPFVALYIHFAAIAGFASIAAASWLRNQECLRVFFLKSRPTAMRRVPLLAQRLRVLFHDASDEGIL
jgi:hypothetical protein